MTMPTRRLGVSSLDVSVLSLGSWRTYETISRDAGLAVMRAARDEGVTFLDDARYDDELGTALIPTGYSEVVFGELYRAADWKRDETIVASKLWWEHWPTEDAAREVDGSLTRMGLDHVDLIYAERPPADLSIDDVVAEVTGLIEAGKARTWGLLNWNPQQTREAHRVAVAAGVTPPATTQLPYSVVQTSPVEDPEMAGALADTGTTVVSSYSLAGGVLTGKYDLDTTTGRAVGRLAENRMARGVAAARALATLAEAYDVDRVTLAFAFVLANPAVDSVLSGATRADQVRQNAAAVRRAVEIDPVVVDRVRTVAATV